MRFKQNLQKSQTSLQGHRESGKMATASADEDQIPRIIYTKA